VRTAGLGVELPRGEGVGYELLAMATRAEAEGVDPEAALRAAARAYRNAIRATEGEGEGSGESDG
jgi:XTP/dITP diphosphohydrolase